MAAHPPLAEQAHDAAGGELGGGGEREWILPARLGVSMVALAQDLGHAVLDHEQHHSAHGAVQDVVDELGVLEQEIDQSPQNRNALLDIHDKGIVFRRFALRQTQLLCPGLAILDQFDAKAVHKEAEELGFIGEVLVKRRAADHRLFAQHGNAHVLVAVLFEQLGKCRQQRAIRFLNAQVHVYRLRCSFVRYLSSSRQIDR